MLLRVLLPLGFGSGSDMTVRIDGYSPMANEELGIYYTRVGSDYLRTMGIGVVEGRDFSDRDTTDARDVTIVNETVVRRYFAGRHAIGGRIRVGQRALEIVGVARDGKYNSLTEAPRPYLYLAPQQWYRADTVLVVKTSADPVPFVQPLHRTLRALDANVPLFDIRTLGEQLAIAVFVQRMIASLVTVFGALALVLATIGLYSVIAGLVAQRTAEIGMRLALGAGRSDIILMVLRQGLLMTSIGVLAGLVSAMGAARLFKSLLVGVSATDAVSFVGTTALLFVVAAAAIYVPARRAASVDPLAALRHE